MAWAGAQRVVEPIDRPKGKRVSAAAVLARWPDLIAPEILQGKGSVGSTKVTSGFTRAGLDALWALSSFARRRLIVVNPYQGQFPIASEFEIGRHGAVKAAIDRDADASVIAE